MDSWLAKIAADLDKPDGLTVLGPSDLPGPLLHIGLEELPGVGRRMRVRLERAGLSTVGDLWNSDPGRLCSIWGNVAGARFWYTLHGYDLEPPPTRRSSIGDGRVLPPEQRSVQTARRPARSRMHVARERPEVSMSGFRHEQGCRDAVLAQMGQRTVAQLVKGPLPARCLTEQKTTPAGRTAAPGRRGFDPARPDRVRRNGSPAGVPVKGRMNGHHAASSSVRLTATRGLVLDHSRLRRGDL